MTTLLETLCAKLAKRKQANVESFWKLAGAIAHGEEVDVAQLEAVLVGLDKTPEDLKRAVELLSERMRLKELIDSEPTLRREREGAEEQIRRANAELEQAEQRYDKTVVPLQAKLSDLGQKLNEVASARERLVQTCPDEALRTRFDEVQATLREVQHGAGQREREIAGWLQEQRSLSDLARSLENTPGGESKLDECVKRIEQLEKQIKEARKQIPALKKEATELERQLDAIREQMMKA